MKLENVKLENLKPLEKNVRKHGDKQIEELIKSIKTFGQTRAIVIDDKNNILIGNGLYLALKKMGIDKAECYRINNLSEKQKKKLVLSDNKIFSLGSDDYEEIQNFIKEISIDGDFEIPGYDEFTIKNMSMDDIEIYEAVADYGTVTDTRFTQEKEETQTNNYDNQKEIYQEEPHQITDERKYVVCPSCGEVIYLD